MDKVIFWDFDGTLVYPNQRFLNSFDFSLKKYGYNLDREKMLEHLKSISPWYNCDTAYPTQLDKWWENFLNGLTPFYDENKVDESVRDNISNLFKQKMTTENNYVVYEDTKFVLQKCIEKGYKNYLLTNNFPELDFFVKDLGLAEYLAGLVISSHVGYEKPRKELYDYAKTMAGCNSGIMVGDNPNTDILGGKNAGLKTVFVHNQSPSEADYSFDTLTKILDII